MAKEFCRFCGKEIDENDTFCPECGKPTWKAEENKAQGTPSSPPKGGKFRINIVQVLMIAVIIILLINIFSPALPISQGDTYKLNYKWECYGQNFTLDGIEIPRNYVEKVQKSTIDRNGTVSSDQYEIDDGKGGKIIVYGVKDYIVIDKYVREVAEKLKNIWINECRDNKRIPNLAQFYAFFCQTAIDYVDDKTSKGKDEYWNFPIETLVDGKGDCEDTSILLAALIQASGEPKYADAAGIFLLPGHAMAAIKVEALNEKYEISHFGYYPIETATHKGTINLWDIGKVMDDYKYVYFQLYKGYVNDKYPGVTF